MIFFKKIYIWCVLILLLAGLALYGNTEAKLFVLDIKDRIDFRKKGWSEEDYKALSNARRRIYYNLKIIDALSIMDQDPSKGLEIIQKLANAKFSLAMIMIGTWHKTGQYGIEKNFKKAADLIEEGIEKRLEEAKKGGLKKCHIYPDHMYTLGMAYLEGDKFLSTNKKKGIEYLEKAANLGSNKACWILMQSYWWGHYDVEKNTQKGLDYAILAADRGYYLCQCALGGVFLGNHHSLGTALDMPEDITKAIHYLTMSANNTDANKPDNLLNEKENSNTLFQAEDQYTLGMIYIGEIGKGVKIDKEKGYELINKAAENNYWEALHWLGVNFLIGRDGFPKNINKAEKYLRKACSLGHAQSQLFLGYNYLHGLGGFPCLPQKGFQLLQEASKNETPVGFLAHSYLGDIYIKGRDFEIRQDTKKGVDHLTKAADGGLSEAQFRLGRMYLSGTFVEKDLQKGWDYILKSAAQKYEQAMEFVTRFHSRRE